MTRWVQTVIAMLLVVLLSGCAVGTTPDREVKGQSLVESGISLGELYNQAFLEEFSLPRFHGFQQYDIGVNGHSANSFGPSVKGSYTKIYGEVEHRDDYTIGDDDYLLMELHAFSKEDVKKNCKTLIGDKTCQMQELSPYLVCETEDYCIYDFMFFDSDMTSEAYFQQMVDDWCGKDHFYMFHYTEEEEAPYGAAVWSARQWLLDELSKGL